MIFFHEFFFQADNEATYKKWLEIKTQERKERRKSEKKNKHDLNSSNVYQNALSQDEKDGNSANLFYFNKIVKTIFFNVRLKASF